MKFIIGKKIGMTQVFSPSGEVIPVTRVKAGPCVVVQIKSKDKGNLNGVEVGFDVIKEYKINKPKAGHLKGLKPLRHLISFNTEKSENVSRGDEITVETFGVGDKVTVQGVSKGRGFAGVVKRHHFRGAPATHGCKHDLRAPGSIGAGGVQRVFKGMRMAGRMGGAPVTVKNLEIIEINPMDNELLIKGAVPGARNGILKIMAEGDLLIKKSDSSVEEVVATQDSVLTEDKASDVASAENANEMVAPESLAETVEEKNN